MEPVSTSTVDSILEHGNPVETALEKEVATDPAKRKALYGGYFERPKLDVETSEKFSYPVLGGAASSAAYTAAGLPGSEFVNDYLAWSYSMGETTGDYFLFMGWAFGVIGSAYLLQGIGKRL